MTHGEPAGVRTYVAIYGWLVVLTALEVAVVCMGWPRIALAAMLIATALAKAMLIALYFMHLKFDRPAVWLFPGIPIALAIFFVGMVFPDVVLHLPLRF